MTKNQRVPKANSSKVGNWRYDGTSWLETGHSYVLVAGLNGLWTAVWKRSQKDKEPDFLKKIAKTPDGYKLKINPNCEFEILAGDILDWRMSKTRELGFIRRRYPHLTKPNSFASAATHDTYSYYRQENSVEIICQRTSGVVSINLGSPQAKVPGVWTPTSSTKKYDQQLCGYLLSVLVQEKTWSDPRPWLGLLRDYRGELTAEFRRAVYQKLIGQFNDDWGSSVYTKADSTSGQLQLDTTRYLGRQLKSKWAKLGARAWWACHVGACINLALGITEFKEAKTKELFKPLLSFINSQLAADEAIYWSLDAPWFNNFLPLAPNESASKTQIKQLLNNYKNTLSSLPLNLPLKDFTVELVTSRVKISSSKPVPPVFAGWPINIAECLQYLHNYKNKEKAE